MRKAIYIWLLFIFISCSKSPVPKGILAIDKMEKVIYDLMQADEYVSNFVVKDSSVDIKKKRSIFYEQIFKLHNTSRKEFYKSYKYYEQHPDIQKTLFDSLSAKAGRKKLRHPAPIPIKPLKVK